MKLKRRKDRKRCAQCRTRPALYITPLGKVRARGDGHDLCAECYRAQRNSLRRIA